MLTYNDSLLRHISIIHRNYTKYMDYELEKNNIGYGQQFFLLCIYESDGITMYDLAKIGKFDKGTVTKAVQKLIEEGYVVYETDIHDRRVKHLHITQKAVPVVEIIYRLKEKWNNLITAGLSKEDLIKFKTLLRETAEKSCAAVNEINQRKEK